MYAYGNGLPGCLFDHMSGPYETAAEAAASAAELLELTEGEEMELATNEILYLSNDRACEVGAHLVQIFEVEDDWECPDF